MTRINTQTKVEMIVPMCVLSKDLFKKRENKKYVHKKKYSSSYVINKNKEIKNC